MSYLGEHRSSILIGLALLSASSYGLLVGAGNLRERLVLYLATHALLALAMFAAWLVQSRTSGSHAVVLASAIVFRAIAVAAEPTLSDDVYRYVWDGRVQSSGVHPFRYAPADPALADIRDDNWSKINHPELKTIYPPGAQITFAALSLVGAGPTGFKLAMAAADMGVILLLSCLLRRLRRPQHLLVLYAWNPLVVLETAGSGHVEPLAVVLLLLAGLWIIEARDELSTIALALAVSVKLLPAALLPAFVRRYRPSARLLLMVVLVAPWVPYAAAGPAIGEGLFAYAQRWEHNAFVYAVLERALEQQDTAERLKPLIDWLRASNDDLPVPWDAFYRWVWPRELARWLVATLAAAWIAFLAARGRRGLLEESLLALGGVLLLSPTLHPWYLLWVLPLAAACRSWGWILFSLTAPLAYFGSSGDVPWPVRMIEYLPVFAVMLWNALGRPAHLNDSRSVSE